jgi:hypothetical protein
MSNLPNNCSRTASPAARTSRPWRSAHRTLQAEVDIETTLVND